VAHKVHRKCEHTYIHFILYTWGNSALTLGGSCAIKLASSISSTMHPCAFVALFTANNFHSITKKEEDFIITSFSEEAAPLREKGCFFLDWARTL